RCAANTVCLSQQAHWQSRRNIVSRLYSRPMIPRFVPVLILVPCRSLAQGAIVTGARSIPAYAARHPIIIDGKLDEQDWHDATPATDFIQSEPHTGRPRTEATEVRVLYDNDHLYIGAYLHDREPDKLIVNDLRKDFAEDQQDDFEVILDTFRDRTNGYVFITNVAGARSDREGAHEGRGGHVRWDGMWSVKTNRVADGWVAEMEIPF